MGSALADGPEHTAFTCIRTSTDGKNLLGGSVSMVFLGDPAVQAVVGTNETGFVPQAETGARSITAEGRRRTP